MPEERDFSTGRHAGVIVPLFSMPSSRSWGIGEIADLPVLGSWLQSAGLDFVQVLPVNEMQEGQNSPYSALSAMAIDPIFIAVEDVPEFHDAGGLDALTADDRSTLDRLRAAPGVDYASVRSLKRRALSVAFEQFMKAAAGSTRAGEFERFVEREREWLDDYALFRVLHDKRNRQYWRDWPAPLRDRDPDALAEVRAKFAGPVRFYQFLQWLAADQWRSARHACGRVGIVGDFPFMVSGHSSDVWARQHEFDIDARVGSPPDAFSATGQDWGLPLYRWDLIEAGGYEWLTQRVRRCAELYDVLRIDHLIGFYRTYAKTPDGDAAFHPPDEPSQEAQGERIMRLFMEHGPRIIAEDLGVIPDFVRASLRHLGVAGMKVQRWERDWHADGAPFHDPASFQAESVAVSGTHDTETVAEWWDECGAEERAAALAIPGLAGACGTDEPYGDSLRDAFLSTLFAAGSDFVLLTFQDVFGWRDRINLPASVSDDNWSWRLPWPVDRMGDQPDATERARFLKAASRQSGRDPAVQP